MVKPLKKKIKGVYNCQPYVIDYSLSAMTNFHNLPEKFPAEVIDQRLYIVAEPAGLYHYRLNYDLSTELVQYVNSNGLGEVFMDSIGVYFDVRRTCVIPDIFFVSKKKSHLLKNKGFFGSPDLVIEILSPSTREYNFTTKKKLYERFGVREYWLVDTDTKEATGFLLKKGTYGAPLIMNSKIYIRIFKKEFSF